MKKIAYMATALVIAASVSLSLASAGRGAQGGTDLLRMLPDGGAVIVVDIQRMTTSSLWTVISSQNKVKDAVDKVQGGLSEVGLKLSDLRTVAVVLPTGGSKDIAGVVSGSFNQGDLLARIRSKPDVKLTSETYKSVEIFRLGSAKQPQAGADANRQGSDMVFAFYDAGTVAFGTSTGVKASIDARAGSRTSVAQNEKLGPALAENPLAALRFAAELTPGMTQGIQASGVPLPDFSSIRLVFGAVDVASGIDLNATLRNETAEKAKNISDQLNGLFGMLKGFLGASNNPKMAPLASALDTVKIVNNDIDVKITGNLSQESLNQILSSR